jgi:cardiolipin synthase
LINKAIPNLITLFRLVLVMPVVWTILHGHLGIALLIFAVAGISDGLDGFLAKRFHWESRIGSILDPIADKTLLMASFTSLALAGFISDWLVWLVIGRDMVIVIGSVTYHYLFGKFELKPLWSSKVNTLIQITFVLAVLIHQGWAVNMMDSVVYLTWGVVLSTVYSGLEYIIVWGNRAWQQLKTHQ